MNTRVPLLLSTLLVFAFSVAEAGIAPSFFRAGNSYKLPQSGMVFEVVQIGEEGWIQIKKGNELLWLNTNLIPMVMELNEQDVKPLAELQKVKETMSDMRAIATSCEAYAVDNNMYPAAANMNELAVIVEPTYIRKLPRKDKWDHGYIYVVDHERQNYWIISYGSDGRKEEGAYKSDGTPAKEGATKEAGSDIIFSNGSFVQWPASASED